MDVEAVCSWVCGLESHCVSMCNPTFCKPLRPFASSLLESHLVSQERSTKHLLHTIMTRKDINRYIYIWIDVDICILCFCWFGWCFGENC